MAELSAFPKGSFPVNTWPVYTWPIAITIVPFDYAEIWDGVVYVTTAISGSVIMNLEVNANVVMNRTIQQTNYSELESTL